MSTKADYTNEEWELLCAGPLLAGLGVSLLDPGLVSGLQESAAIHRATHEAHKAYADNQLVQAVLAEIEAKGEAAYKAPAGATPESVLAQLVKIDAILDAKGKAGDDAADEGIVYRNFLYQVADKAANAAGGFMGLGDKVSEEEAYYLKKLKEILFREPAT
jgi:hypothetical protein